MGEATETLRKDIEETKADLSERFELLAERAGRAVDVNYQLSSHPWASLAIAVGAGLVLGYLTSTPDGSRPREGSRLPRHRDPGVLSSIAAHAVGGVLRDLARRSLGG
jgi:hypothetical protein